MTKARTLADNFAADINGITAGTGITGGGTSGTVTITNDMATSINAKGDLVVGTANDTYSRLAVASTAGYILTVDSAETTGLKWAAPAGGGKVLQVVTMSTTSSYSQTATTYSDITGYNLSITPSSSTSKVLVIFNPSLWIGGVATQLYQGFQIVRNSTVIMTVNHANVQGAAALGGGYTWQYTQPAFIWLDSPATTSSVTYKAQTKDAVTCPHGINLDGTSTITLLEIGA